MLIPQKLSAGDEIRIIAPSRSAGILSEEGIEKATERLEELGLRVTFGAHIFESDLQNSASIQHRVEDLHAAFADTNVKGILTVIGGFNCNELLPYLDYEMIRQNPKILCGYSDITALTNAITARCGFITYSGPHFSSFQMDQGQAYQTAFFKHCLMGNEPFSLQPSEKWSDDAWYLDQDNRVFEPTEWKVYNEGKATGTLYGGNLCTLNLLQGTELMPDIQGAVLFVEDDELVFPEMFARDLASLLQAAGSIRGLVIGRFQKASNMTEEQFTFILDKHPRLKEIPVLYGVDFGHTQPIFTFPIGGEVEIDSGMKMIKLLTF